MSDFTDKEMLEIEAMKKIVELFAPLDDDTRSRILRWATDKFKVVVEPLDTIHPEEIEESVQFTDLPNLFNKINPSSGSEKVLVAGYWFQVCDGNPDLTAQEINTALKHLGHGVSNVTNCMSILMGTRPQQVMQVRKSGTTQQARKKYKLTTAGIKRVDEMIQASGEE